MCSFQTVQIIVAQKNIPSRGNLLFKSMKLRKSPIIKKKVWGFFGDVFR